MYFNRYFQILAIGFCLISSACQDYQITLNERAVYEPPPLLESFAVADTALETCIAQTITDLAIVKLQDLKTLRCTSAGIRSLSGLEQLKFLEQLDFSSNHLMALTPLQSLDHLRQLRLQRNPDLPCEEIEKIEGTQAGLKVIGPDRCE